MEAQGIICLGNNGWRKGRRENEKGYRLILRSAVGRSRRGISRSVGRRGNVGHGLRGGCIDGSHIGRLCNID